MHRILFVAALLLFCLLPGRLAGQQPYPRLARLVSAVRTAALVSAAAPPRSTDPLEVGFGLPPLARPPAISRRQVLHVTLSGRLQFLATGDWPSPGPVARLGLGVQF